jgi:hypothetical protein
MNNQVPKYVTQARASLLLGLPEAELSRISKESRLGQVERAGNEEETYFTYEELLRICMLAEHQMPAAGHQTRQFGRALVVVHKRGWREAYQGLTGLRPRCSIDFAEKIIMSRISQEAR